MKKKKRNPWVPKEYREFTKDEIDNDGVNDQNSLITFWYRVIPDNKLKILKNAFGDLRDEENPSTLDFSAINFILKMIYFCDRRMFYQIREQRDIFSDSVDQVLNIVSELARIEKRLEGLPKGFYPLPETNLLSKSIAFLKMLLCQLKRTKPLIEFEMWEGKEKHYGKPPKEALQEWIFCLIGEIEKYLKQGHIASINVTETACQSISQMVAALGVSSLIVDGAGLERRYRRYLKEALLLGGNSPENS